MREHPTDPSFRHDAFLYEGEGEFVREMTSFVREGLALGEPVLVVVIPPKIALLRDALGDRASDVEFADMSAIGRNPARIIPLWQEFVSRHAGAGRVRGIGEPIWAGRTPEEIVEAQRHESLINLAFEGAAATILCPYDVTGLDPPVIEESFRSHPNILGNGSREASRAFLALEEIAKPFDAPLTEPEGDPYRLVVDAGTLEAIRRFVAGYASESGLDAARTQDLILAVNEVATNTVRHSGGPGIFRMWQESGSIVAEVSDHGRIDPPLAGRRAPTPDQDGGIGLWITNQLCDLVQIRVYDGGSVVRLHMSRNYSEPRGVRSRSGGGSAGTFHRR